MLCDPDCDTISVVCIILITVFAYKYINVTSCFYLKYIFNSQFSNITDRTFAHFAVESKSAIHTGKTQMRWRGLKTSSRHLPMKVAKAKGDLP